MHRFDKVSFIVQNIESLTNNSPTLNTLNVCKVAMLKMRYKGGNSVILRRFRGKTKARLTAHWLEVHGMRVGL